MLLKCGLEPDGGKGERKATGGVLFLSHFANSKVSTLFYKKLATLSNHTRKAILPRGVREEARSVFLSHTGPRQVRSAKSARVGPLLFFTTGKSAASLSRKSIRKLDVLIGPLGRTNSRNIAPSSRTE